MQTLTFMQPATRDVTRPGDPSRSRGDWPGRVLVTAEWAVAIFLSAAAVHLHVSFMRNAGGLWRDEAGFVHLATLPSWGRMWAMLAHGSHPLLVPALIREWVRSGPGGADPELRALGFCFGMALPLGLWLASAAMRRGPPILPLALVAVNATTVRAGSSLRAYGLGTALAVVALAAFWGLVRRPGPGRAVLAAVAAVAGAQSLYQNAFFVLAASVAGVTVCVTSRRWRDALVIVAVGLVAAASLVPYVGPLLRAQDWFQLQKSGFDVFTGWKQASAATGFPFPAYSLLWVALCVGALGYGVARVSFAAAATDRELILFSSTALAAGLAGFAFFLKVSELPTQPWHYVPVMAFAAATLDCLVPCRRPARLAVVALAAMTLVTAYPRGLAAMRYRQTNVDLIASRLNQDVSPHDYVVVHPWYCGISFARYYAGPAPWTTLPPLEDCGTHRYDLLKAQMQRDRPIRPVLEALEATLRGGHRVWIVGPLEAYPGPAPEVNPAPHNPWGWWDVPYVAAWGTQTHHFLLRHATRAAVLPAFTRDPVNPVEDLPVAVVSGWYRGNRNRPE
jgi:hypothetical protein